MEISVGRIEASINPAKCQGKVVIAAPNYRVVGHVEVKGALLPRNGRHIGSKGFRKFPRGSWVWDVRGPDVPTKVYLHCFSPVNADGSELNEGDLEWVVQVKQGVRLKSTSMADLDPESEALMNRDLRSRPWYNTSTGRENILTGVKIVEVFDRIPKKRGWLVVFPRKTLWSKTLKEAVDLAG